MWAFTTAQETGWGRGDVIYVGATLVIALGNAWYHSNPRRALAFLPFALAIGAELGGESTATRTS